MNSQFVPLCRNEIGKAARRKLPYFGFFALGLLGGLIYLVAGELSAAASVNAWGYLGFSMQCLFSDIGLIFILVFSGMLLAEETGSGTIRAALAVPVHRWELYLAKAAAAMLYTLALSTVALLLSVAFARIRYRFGPVTDPLGLVYGRGKVFTTFLWAWVLSWVPLGALAMYGLLISTLMRSSGSAVAVGISTLYLIDFTKHFVGLDPYIFTKYVGYPWLILQEAAQGVDFQWAPGIWKMLGLSAAYGLAALGLGLVIFQKQDLND